MEDVSKLVTARFPYFVALAYEELSRFLEALGLSFVKDMYMSVEYSPGAEELVNDPDCGEVTFGQGTGTSVTFLFRYRPGEEGTRGSLSRIDKIVVRNGRTIVFDYIEHRCHCGTCRGLKYPFCPSGNDGVKPYAFEQCSEEGRLHLIREHFRSVK